MTWRVAQSLLTLRAQIDARYPNRSRVSDGTIGDVAHASRTSDHNPWYQGNIVTAMDITHDPAHGVDINRLTDELAASRDRRIKYIIANRLILDSRPGFNPWRWVPYSGSNPHTRHFHLSVVASPLADDPTPWRLPSLGAAGGGAALPGGGEEMALNQSDLRDIYDAVWFGVPGARLISTRQPGKPNGWPEYVLGSVTDWVVRQQLAPMRGQLDALTEVMKQIAGNQEVDLEAVRAAAEAGTRKALEEGTVDVDITVAGGGSGT